MSPQMQSGFELVVIGMGTVFVFLGVLVVITIIMSRILNRIAPEFTVLDDKPQEFIINEQLLAVLQDAVRQHRARRKKR